MSGLPYRQRVNLRSRRLSLLAALALVLGVPTPAGADDGVVEVTSVVRGEDGPPVPLSGVIVWVWHWLGGDDNVWDPVLSEGQSNVTDADGQFTLSLPAGETYSLSFDAPGSTYPVQYLGGGPDLPANPNAVDWEVATFVAGEDPLPSPILLFPEAQFSGAGFVIGDEDGDLVNGIADLIEVADGVLPGGELVATEEVPAEGSFVFHGLRAGSHYTVRALADSYLPTYLGNTTQPELASSFVVGDTHQSIEEIALRRGATVTGTITSGGTPVELAHVSALRWDATGGRWLEPVHFGGTETDTDRDGLWALVLEPHVTYTLFVDTEHATTASGQVPASHYLGGEIDPPSPGDPAATFELLPSGDHRDWALTKPSIGLLANPVVSGHARIGDQLTSTTGSWAVDGLSYSRQWLRSGTPIPGATGTSYSPTVADVGKQLSVRVTASKPGFATAEATSAATALVTPPPDTRASTTTTLTLSKSRVKFGAKVTTTVAVRATAGTPDGAVTLTLDGKTLATKQPTVRGTNATVRFTLPRSLKTGKHRLVASAAPTTTVIGSSSATQSLRTTKAKVKVKVKVPKKWRTPKGKRPRLTITVKGTKGGPKPSGKIVVKIGKKKYTKTLKAGKAKVRGVKLRKSGRIKVKVTYRPAAKTYAKPKVVRKTLRVR